MRFLLILLCVWFIPQSALALFTAERTEIQAEFSPTRLIVKLKPEVDKGVRLTVVRGMAVTGLAPLDSLNFKFRVTQQGRLFKEFRETALKSAKLSGVHILKVTEGTDLKRMQQEYESRPEVEYAELDYKVSLFDQPDDPLFPHQWYLNNTGQGYLGVNRVPGDGNDTQVIKYGTEDADIDALEAFERGDEVTVTLVGIIDTGLDLDHPDLADNVWTNPGEIPENGTDDDHNGFVDDFYGWDFSDHLDDNNRIVEDNDPTDYYGHGTHCAGIAASVRDNALGVSGINTPCKIMAIKVFPYAFHSVCAKGIIYAADNGCEVINVSWGGAFPSKLIEDALDYAIDRGVLPIAAAGNSGGEDYFYPASLPQVFTVGATNSDDEVTTFSTYGEHIDVVAPGEDILSLRADSTDMYAEGGASGVEPFVHIVNGIYYLADGTSMASPCVVGVAAYVLAASPGISAERLKEIVEQSADDVLYPYGGDSLYSPGKDIYSGHGRVNLNSALQLTSGTLAKIDYPYENAIVSGDVAIIGTASGDSFETYVLEYGEGYCPEQWIEIVNSDLPVTNDTLGIWSSFGMSGRYTLRLTVGNQNQAMVHVAADNDVYVKITSPDDGDTVTNLTQVWGYTVAPDFSHYVLEYGYGESPSFWIPIDSSTKMVADDLLGNWMVSFLAGDNYSLRLNVHTSGGEIYSDTVVVRVGSIASDSWSVDLVSYGSLSPAVGDIDGDGYDEIVVGVGRSGSGGSGGIEVFTHEGERESGWPKDTDKNMMSCPALADLDGDDIDDIVICCRQEGVHAYLSTSQDWIGVAEAGGGLWSLAAPLIADLENDGYPEVLTINDKGQVYAWRHDGQSVIPGNDGFFAQTVVKLSLLPSLVVADLDGDGENEVIAGAARGGCNPPPCWADGGIYIWDAEGDLLLGPGDYPEALTKVHGIALANIDENDDLEIIVFAADTSCNMVAAFKKDGTQVTNYPILVEDLATAQWLGNHPSVGDLEGDGIMEIVVSAWAIGEGRIYGWHQDGTPLGSLGSNGLLISMKLPDAERRREFLSRLGSSINDMMILFLRQWPRLSEVQSWLT
jgi:subtilisin family serine protease